MSVINILVYLKSTIYETMQVHDKKNLCSINVHKT